MSVYVRRIVNNDNINFSAGNTGGVKNGANTIYAVVKRNLDGASHYNSVVHDQTNFNWEAYFDNGGGGKAVNSFDSFSANVNRGSSVAGISGGWTLLASGGWTIVVQNKAAGLASPNYWKADLATLTWSQAVDSAQNDGTGWATGAQIGSSGTSDTGSIDIAAVVIFNSVLSDATVRTLTTRAAVEALGGLTAYWLLNQASTGTSVSDLSGGGANQSSITGTSVQTDSDAGLATWYGGSPPRFGFINHTNPGIA